MNFSRNFSSVKPDIFLINIANSNTLFRTCQAKFLRIFESNLGSFYWSLALPAKLYLPHEENDIHFCITVVVFTMSILVLLPTTVHIIANKILFVKCFLNFLFFGKLYKENHVEQFPSAFKQQFRKTWFEIQKKRPSFFSKGLSPGKEWTSL